MESYKRDQLEDLELCTQRREGECKHGKGFQGERASRERGLPDSRLVPLPVQHNSDRPLHTEALRRG